MVFVAEELLDVADALDVLDAGEPQRAATVVEDGVGVLAVAVADLTEALPHGDELHAEAGECRCPCG